MKSYRDLKVWQNNQGCIHQAAQLFKTLPQEYAIQHIVKQLFRSISSIGANLAEGQDSYKGKEFVRYIDIAVRSAIESDHWLATLKNMVARHEVIDVLESSNLEVIKMLKGLRQSIEEKRSEH